MHTKPEHVQDLHDFWKNSTDINVNTISKGFMFVCYVVKYTVG